MAKTAGWWETRLGLGRSLRNTLNEKIPGGAKFTYALGSATLLTFLTLAVTGIWELFYYVPSTAHAYDSVNYIRFQVPFGWLIHGIHFWAASLMVVLVLLHLMQAFFWGAFKKPRELTWLLGVALLIFTLAAVFTGSPLAWDDKGYWAARVGAGLAGSIPLIGSKLQQLVFGGSSMGQFTLSRLFPIHIAIIPIALGCIMALHLKAFRRGGAAGSIRSTEKLGDFWPTQIIMDLLVYSGVLTLLVGASAWLAPAVQGPADPLDPTYVARPDWPFLWLFQLLKYLHGPGEWLGFVLIPLVGIALLFAVPWIDRTAERNPAKRPLAVAAFVVVVAAVGWLTWMGATAQTATLAGAGTPGPTPAAAIESTPPVPGPSAASRTVGSATHGKLIFDAYCAECHGAEGKKGIANPRSADGEVPSLNPIDPEIKGKAPVDVQSFIDAVDTYVQNGSVPESDPEGADPKYKMPSFGNTYALSQPQIANAEAYVLQLNGVDNVRIEHPGVEPKTYAYWVFGGFLVVAVAGGVALAGDRRRTR